MFVGIRSIQTAGSQNSPYLASIIRQNNKRTFYNGHRWGVVAGTCSFESGICASADEFGEIHLWRLSNGKRIKVLKPTGHDLHHIQWEPDESGIMVGTRYLEPKKDKVRYDFNRYGPVTHSFGFQQWDLKEDDREAKYLPSIRLLGQSGQTAFNAVFDSGRGKDGDLRLDTPGGRSEYLLGYLRNGNEKQRKMVRKWGNPTSIAVLDDTETKRSHLLIGTDLGALLEFSIETQYGRNQLQLRRKFLGHESRVTALSVSPSGKFLASASIDGTARIWNLTPARKLADADFYTDGTRVIHLEPGGAAERAGIMIGDSIRKFDNGPYYERIQKIQNEDYSVGDQVAIGLVRNDGTAKQEYLEYSVRLTETNDVQEPELSLFFSQEDQWIAWNQDGYYNCSADGDRHVGWHVNQGRENAAEFSRVSQFQRKLYRPDIIQDIADSWTGKSILRNDGPRVAVKPKADAKVSIPNTAKNYKEMKPPNIIIGSHQSSETVDSDTVRIEFAIERPIRLEILESSLFNNGKPVSATFEKVGTKNSGGIATTRYHVEVPLEIGLNHLVFEAEHKHATSNRPSLKITRRGKEPEQVLPKLYLLAVGISEYEKSEFDLEFADKDADDFHNALKQQSEGVFSKVVSRVLTNEKAGTNDIREGFEWLIDQKPGSNDVVFVFFSGRAFFSSSDRWFFGGNDFDPKSMRSTSISNSDLNVLLETELRDAGKVMAFLDTCRQSEGDKGWPRIHQSKGIDIWKTTRRPVLLSCSQKQTSLVNEKAENGYFTDAIIRSLAMKRLDREGDGFISLQELVSGTRKLLLKETRQGQALAMTGVQLGGRDFVLGKLPDDQ